ncbi:MAG: glutathione S-transferase family protein [Ectothiorhodospiraceae bacterium]|nr:glutathione S-transferase family protein [Ectothiorhodospiraceae bacterium]
MRLYCTPGSPYARVVRIAALELGIDQKLEVEFVTVRDPASVLLPLNPTGKVPTLVTDEGAVLSETRVCVEHLEQLTKPRRLSASAGDARGRAREGMSAGFMDGIANWGREHRRPQPHQWPWMHEVERARAERCLAYFEMGVRDGDFPSDVGVHSEQDLGVRSRAGHGADQFGPLNLADVILFCALDWGARNVPEFRPGDGRPRLGQWYADFREHPSARATEPA